jgi:4'-phosphopantetheinyl transferase
MSESPPTQPDWTRHGIRLWLRPHVARHRGEPTARTVLGPALGLQPSALPIERDSCGRPHLRGALGRHDVGWSHSGDALLIALGDAVELGVDVEQLRPRTRALDIAQRFFHADEADWLRAQPEPERDFAFFRLWCAKEAVLKAHGQGVSFGMDRLVFAEHAGRLSLDRCDAALGSAGDWTLDDWQPKPGYHAALAWRRR